MLTVVSVVGVLQSCVAAAHLVVARPDCGMVCSMRQGRMLDSKHIVKYKCHTYTMHDLASNAVHAGCLHCHGILLSIFCQKSGGELARLHVVAPGFAVSFLQTPRQLTTSLLMFKHKSLCILKPLIGHSHSENGASIVKSVVGSDSHMLRCAVA